MNPKILDVFIREPPLIQDFFSSLRDGFELNGIWYRLRSKSCPDVWVDRNELDGGVIRLEGFPDFRDAMSVWTERSFFLPNVLEAAQLLGEQYWALMYNSRLKQPITSFMANPKYDPSSSVPQGRLVNNSEVKAALIENWDFDTRMKYRALVSDSCYYFTPSGHVQTLEDIFGIYTGGIR